MPKILVPSVTVCAEEGRQNVRGSYSVSSNVHISLVSSRVSSHLPNWRLV